MTPTEGIALLDTIRRRRQWRGTLVLALPALGVALLVGAAAYRWLDGAWGAALPAFVAAWALAVLWAKPYRVSTPGVARHLNALFPSLEESTHLLLKPGDELSLLERMQTGRLLAALRETDVRPATRVPHRPHLLALLGGGLVAAAMLGWPAPPPEDALFAASASLPAPFRNASLPAKPRIRTLAVAIAPPGYTGRPGRTQSTPDITAEAGSRVQWQIRTDVPAERVALVFNDRDVLPLQRTGDAWTAGRTITENGIYQIKLNDERSDYYRLEAVPDAPPVVTVTAPEPYVSIDYGRPLHVPVRVQLRDDYGLQSAWLVATVAKGSGEAVKFREEKIGLGAAFGKFQREAGLVKELQLAAMDMAPGDELYFYVEALDNHAQATRSDMFIAALTDTAQVTLADAMTMGINPVPEYFRSQRQIIIDTEKLLKERPRLTEEAFKARSNATGIDQKVLRLRYGKFLGEEFEDMIGEIAGQEKMVESGHFDGDGHDHADAMQGLEAFVHAHDESEEATFLEPAVKTKLKACLAQMWEAELRLRTYRPREALPYEYKALKLLKEVQQSSRAYVAKTGFEPPPLKPGEKRLTGELDKVGQPRNQREYEPDRSFPAVREAVPVLATLQSGNPLSGADVGRLEKAGVELGAEAIRQPGRYLPALRALRQLIGEAKAKKTGGCTGCVAVVQAAFWSVLPPAPATPQPLTRSGSSLGELYLDEISD
ncbi:MAG: FIG045085: Hypothetical protein [uncultured Cytophagales bacterium]|uniref:DUF4175 domain-containing protein n=1 Tax=uncultured Cytophagales bacterium TaxID=158755 RepID=A0A6J4KAC6_9SPHI|nr:MAG: FIG045085: Hypothetical protein [uncultured Cytophagales bacterium]